MSPIISRNEMNYEEYDAVIAACEGRTTITAAPEAPFSHETLSLGDVTLQVMEEGGANIFEAGASDNQVSLCVGLPGPTPTRFLGVDFDSNQLGLIRPGDTVMTSTKGISHHSELTLPVGLLIEAVERFDPSLTERMMFGAPLFEIEEANWRRFVSLVNRLMARAWDGKALQTLPEQQAAITELVRTFIEGAVPTPEKAKAVGRRRKSRSRILKRVRDYLHSELCCSYSVVEMAEYAQVSERTLRNVVTEEYGVAPMRLIVARQLRDIHAALRIASDNETVSSIAARHGVWEWGRLSQRYSSIYGRLPSETLTASTGRNSAG